jgi:hypothetical protein
MEAVGLLEAIRTASSAQTPPRGHTQDHPMSDDLWELMALGGNSTVG